MNEKAKTLEFTLSMKFIAAGVVLVAISLLMPAIKHGKVLTGLESNAIGTVMAFIGVSKGQTSTEMVMLCRAAVAANTLALLTVLLGSASNSAFQVAAVCTFGALILCLFYLCFAPYRGIEAIYTGYYIWIAGLFLVGIGGIWELALARIKT